MNYKLKDIPQRELAKGIKGKYVHTKNNTIGFVEIEKGAVLPAHFHVHEQTTCMISGKLEMTIDGKIQVLEPGDVVVIPSNTIHSALALTDCELTDTFYPIRDDYK